MCIGLSLEPVIGAIAGGNTVVLKPSELAPTCSTVLANAVHTYLDNKAIKVVEGGPSVAQLLLNQKWDKIFFTGSYYSILTTLTQLVEFCLYRLIELN